MSGLILPSYWTQKSTPVFLRSYRLIALLGNYTYDLLLKSEKVDKEITNNLYQDYKSLRLKLISALESDNKDVSTLDAIRFGQTILDRILFIAFAEDKGLLPNRSIEQAYEHADPYNPKPIWENFKGLFRAIDQGNTALNIPQYNGGLFKQDEAIEYLNVSDQVCEEFRDMSRYDFNSEVGVTILGHIFEQSISDIEGLQNYRRRWWTYYWSQRQDYREAKGKKAWFIHLILSHALLLKKLWGNT